MSTNSGKSELLFTRISSEICFHFSLPSGDFKDGLVKMARVMEVVLVILLDTRVCVCSTELHM